MANSKFLFTTDVLWDVEVTQRHIHQMSSIFGKMPGATVKYSEFIGHLGQASSAQEITMKAMMHSPYQIFQDALLAWRSKNGSAAKFSTIFRALGEIDWDVAKEQILQTELEGLKDYMIKPKVPAAGRTEIRVPVIVDVLLKDSTLLSQWSHLADILGLQKADYIAHERQYLNGTGGIRDLFERILNCWVLQNSTTNVVVSTLGGKLRGINYVNTAETIEGKFGLTTTIEAS